MLALVAKHPTLYDHTMPKYKFTDVKQAIWEEITRTVLGKDDRKTGKFSISTYLLINSIVGLEFDGCQVFSKRQ